MEPLFAGRVPKDPAHPDEIDDTFELDVEAGRIAVSDGASESYDSRTWSRLLVARFARDTRVGPAWLRRAASDYTSRFDRDTLSWSRQAAFDRGSFATLLGVTTSAPDGSIRISAVGDTIAVLLDGNACVASFPYDAAEQFRQRPQLFSTLQPLNAFYESARYRRAHRQTWSTLGLADPLLVCMTDGLAEWALRQAAGGRSVWAELLAVRTEAELRALIDHERRAGGMRIDDVTLVTARLR